MIKKDFVSGYILQKILNFLSQTLTAKTIELDNLKAEWTARLNDQMAKHKQEMAAEKERVYQVRSDMRPHHACKKFLQISSNSGLRLVCE